MVLGWSGTGAIAEIKIKCISGPAAAPEKPELIVPDGYYYQYDKENNRLGITTLPSVGIVKVPLPENAMAVYYTFNAEIAVPTSTTDNTLLDTGFGANPNEKWIEYSEGYSTSSNIDFGWVKPQGLDDFSTKQFKLRVVGFGGGQFGEELVTDCYYTPLPAPEVDVAQTEAEDGQTYDPKTNTVYYTGGNPVVYIKAAQSNSSITSRYMVDGDPTENGTAINSSGAVPVRIQNWDGDKNEYPVPGTFNKVKVVSKASFQNIPQGVNDEYFLNHGEPFTVTLRRVAPSAPGVPVVNSYTVDGGTAHVWDAPKTLRIAGKVELTLRPESGATVNTAIFDHEPTVDELADNTKFAVATLTDGKLTVAKDAEIDVAAGKTECWLAIKKSNESGYSQPMVIHVALQGPAEPALEMLYGYLPGASSREYTVLRQTLASRLSVADGVTTVEYQFIRKENNPTVPDPTQWTTWDISDKGDILDQEVISEDGRLFIRAVAALPENPDAKVRSEYVYYDFTCLRPYTTTLADKAKWTGGLFGEGQLVVINEDLRVMGFYGTNAVNNPQYMYLMNKDGHVLKVSGMPTDGCDWRSDIKQLDGIDLLKTIYVMPKGSVVGRIHFNDDKDLPELQATRGIVAGSENLTPLFGVPQEDPDWQLSAAGNALHHLADRKEVSRANDFGRYVELRSLRWLDANDEFEMADGSSRMQLYPRLTVTLSDQTLGKGNLYRVKGFIGLADGKLSIFPVADIEQCPGTPNLYAPNPIKPGVNDTDAQGRIKVQAVSDVINIRAEGHANGESNFWYTRSDREGMIAVDNATRSFDLDLADGDDINVDVYAELNGMKSLVPARIRVVKMESTEVSSINDFKTREFAQPSTSTIYQLKGGRVIVEQITDRYLYVRDYTEEPAVQLSDDEHMNRLLILNTNGWEATVADANDASVNPRKLEKGDVITNFAIVPMHDHGNLMSNATGFARTFRLVGRDEKAIGDAMPIDAGLTDDFAFTADHRMRFVTLKGAQVYREPNTGDDKDLYPYNYTITTIKGNPRMRMDVFVRSGFAEAYAENEDFNLTGIVMLDSESGDINDASKFAFALQSFTGSGKLATPQVFISGTTDKGEENISYNKPGTITMTAPTKTDDNGVLAEGTEVKLYYALGGIDPLKDKQARREYQGEDWDATDMELGDGDVEIRVFAAAPGMTPSDVVVRRFKKESHDVQFILNFLETAKESECYRFTGDTRIVAVGGKYMFVAGRVGHYLPIRLTHGWDGLGMNPGMMLTNFTVGYTVDEHGNRMATADGFADTFKPTAASADETLDPVPDETTRLSLKDHPRRLVRLKGVKVNVPAAAPVSETGITEWEVVESGDNETHIMPAGKLGEVKILDAKGNAEADFTAGESYDIVGFVMRNSTRDVQMEIWPVEARHLSRVAEVEARFSDGTTVQRKTDEIEASFDGMTTVELSCATGGARILYAFGDVAKADLVWYEYKGRPITVTANEYIHAKAEADNAVESDHTHINLIRKDMASDVKFTVDNSTPGKAVVTLSAATPGAKIYWWTGTNDEETLYDVYAAEPIVLTETDIVYAYAKAGGMVDGNVCHKLVKVVSETTGQEPSDRVSGRVQFEQIKTDDGKVLVSIKPEQPIAGGYQIYYTLDGVIEFDDDHLYREPGFEMPESGYVMAVLVENGKPAGQTCEVYVWVVPANPSAIGSVGADSADAVRVEGSSIIAPEGSEVYDIAGRRVRPEGLRSGIYIVRTPDGKAVKLTVNN